MRRRQAWPPARLGCSCNTFTGWIRGSTWQRWRTRRALKGQLHKLERCIAQCGTGCGRPSTGPSKTVDRAQRKAARAQRSAARPCRGNGKDATSSAVNQLDPGALPSATAAFTASCRSCKCTLGRIATPLGLLRGCGPRRAARRPASSPGASRTASPKNAASPQ